MVVGHYGVLHASALTLPIRWRSVNCLHKHVRIVWTTTHCRFILDDIGMKLFSGKTIGMTRHFFNKTVIGPLWTIGQGVE